MVQRYKILLILIAKNKLFCIFAPKKINYLSNKPFKFCSVMKVLRVLFMAFALLMVSGLSAQTVYNSNGSSCGKIESNGTVRNSSGSSIRATVRFAMVPDRASVRWKATAPCVTALAQRLAKLKATAPSVMAMALASARCRAFPVNG